MLVLVFKLGDDRYALPTADVILLVPAVPLRSLPRTPDFIAGVFEYKGLAVPVVDLQLLTKQQPCEQRLSTRIMLTNYTAPKSGRSHVLGLMAEDITNVLEIDRKQIKGNAVTVGEAPYLGDIATGEEGLIQLLEPNKILPNALQDTLFVR
ncbi:MAG: chemotaxis protein CheW [Verrucomicrobiota bacterium]